MTNPYVLRELSRYSLGTFADIVYRNALLYPEKEAVVHGPRRLSYAAYNREVNRLINGLRTAGLKKGDVIGILSWNCLEFMLFWGAAMKGGFIIAPFNARSSDEELVTVIDDSCACAMFVGPDYISRLNLLQRGASNVTHWFSAQSGIRGVTYLDDMISGASPDEPEPVVTEDDPLIIFYTSGTTGDPRGAWYTHKSKLSNTIIKALDIGLTGSDRNLIVLPMFHVGGDSHIWPFFLTGGCNIIIERSAFNPAVMLDIIQAERISDVHIVPTQLVALLNFPHIDAYDLTSLKRIWYAASPMPLEILKRGIERFGPVFIQGYGMTESGPHTTVLPKDRHLTSDQSQNGHNILASCGQPCIGVHMRVVDLEDNDRLPGQVGEIIVRADRLMSGYWHRPEDTQNALRDGWLRTGDMGYYDENGYIFIADRKKDMIITGGENVYPREVEDVLYEHFAVSEAAVIGVPDEYWVERVHALIVMQNGESVSAEEIIAFCKARLAHFKAPKTVEFIEALPKSPQGKILKKELRKKYWPDC